MTDMHCLNCDQPGAVKTTETHYIGGKGHQQFETWHCADWEACMKRLDAIEEEHGSFLLTTIAAERHNAAVLAGAAA